MKQKYRNTIVSISEMISNNKEDYNNIYSTFKVYDDETLNMAVQKLKDNFDFLKYQITMVGFIDNKGDIRYEYPVIVTNVLTPDENGHNSYTYEHNIRGNCEYIGTQSDTERYLWRWTTKSKIPNWYLELLEYQIEQYVNSDKGSDDAEFLNHKEEICFIEDGKLYYPFRTSK